MANKVGHEGAHPSQPSTPTSQDSDRQREEPDSNQSNHRCRIDDTSAAVYENNGSRSSSSQENPERLIEQLFLQQIDRQMEEDALHDTDDSVNDDDNETEEEESLVSDERSNSNSQDDLNQQGTSVLAVLLPNADGVGRRQYGIDRLISLNRNVGLTLDVDGMSYEELTELGDRIGIVKRGLPKEFISSHLKTRVHTTYGDSMGEEETEICTVCQDGYENKDKIATLDCKHEYHQNCITQWLLQKNVCPVCKGQALKTMEESKKEVVNEC
ncbi:hypothetical protein MKW92_039189 [Papaver armeniacum]|nr:hypothetical protein MKW92_039189 [Papaver armeniacum]